MAGEQRFACGRTRFGNRQAALNGHAEEFWFRAEKALLWESEQHEPEALPDDLSHMDDLIGAGRRQRTTRSA